MRFACLRQEFEIRNVELEMVCLPAAGLRKAKSKKQKAKNKKRKAGSGKREAESGFRNGERGLRENVEIGV